MDTLSNEYRWACEVRSVAKLPREQRLAYYQAVSEIRGKEVAKALSDAVRKLKEVEK